MGDFSWRPLANQDGLAGGVVPPSTTASVVGEGGQFAGKVGRVVVVVEVIPGTPFYVMAKRKQDDGVLGHLSVKS